MYTIFFIPALLNAIAAWGVAHVHGGGAVRYYSGIYVSLLGLMVFPVYVYGVGMGPIWSLVSGSMVWGLLGALVGALFGMLAIRYGRASTCMQSRVVWRNMLNAIGIGIVTPVVEEIVFRGCAYVLLSHMGFWIPAILSSVAFGLSHINWLGIPKVMIGSALFGLVLYALLAVTGSLLAPILAHVAANSLFLFGAWRTTYN